MNFGKYLISTSIHQISILEIIDCVDNSDIVMSEASDITNTIQFLVDRIEYSKDVHNNASEFCILNSSVVDLIG